MTGRKGVVIKVDGVVTKARIQVALVHETRSVHARVGRQMAYLRLTYTACVKGLTKIHTAVLVTQ